LPGLFPENEAKASIKFPHGPADPILIESQPDIPDPGPAKWRQAIVPVSSKFVAEKPDSVFFCPVYGFKNFGFNFLTVPALFPISPEIFLQILIFN